MEDVLFITSSNQAETGTAQLAHHVLSEASRIYPQLANIRPLQITLQRSKLNEWSAWLAVEVIEQWLDCSSIDMSVDSVLMKLGLVYSKHQVSPLLTTLSSGTGGVFLASELSSKVSSIQYRYSHEKDAEKNWQALLEEENLALARWFSRLPKTTAADSSLTGSERIEFNAKALQIKNQLYLKEAIVSWRQTGLHSALKVLKALGERLTTIYAEYDQQRQIFKRKEASAWRAFNNLSSRLQEQNFLPRKRPVTFDMVLQALLKAYSFKLEAEIYTQACQLVGRLRQEIHLLACEFVQANRFLNQLKQEFMENSFNEPFLAPVLMHVLMQKLNVLTLRRDLEAALGRPAYLWGGLRQFQKAIVRQQLLSQLNPLCLEVYAQCYTSLMSLQMPGSQLESVEARSNRLMSQNFSDSSQQMEGASSYPG